VVAAGDANCDQGVTAADLPALLRVLFGTPDPCGGADITGDGRVDEADVPVAIEALFRNALAQ